MTTFTVPRPLPEAPLRGGMFVATFRPAACWSPEIREWAGMRCSWKVLWRISAGPCRGQWACAPVLPKNQTTRLAWAPSGELVDDE
jgi:hypothetical protein